MRQRDRSGWWLAGFLALVLFSLGHVVGESMLEHREQDQQERRRDSLRRQVTYDTIEARLERIEAYNDSLESVVDTLDHSPAWR